MWPVRRPFWPGPERQPARLRRPVSVPRRPPQPWLGRFRVAGCSLGMRSDGEVRIRSCRQILPGLHAIATRLIPLRAIKPTIAYNSNNSKILNDGPWKRFTRPQCATTKAVARRQPYIEFGHGDSLVVTPRVESGIGSGSEHDWTLLGCDSGPTEQSAAVCSFNRETPTLLSTGRADLSCTETGLSWDEIRGRTWEFKDL